MKVSIITVTYNSAATVEDTILSVLRQTYPDIEYIVVDGGSKDRTMALVKRYETAFGGRLKWVSEPDKGIYDAMNKGIRMASGEVAGILNSDDYYTSDDVIANMVQAFRDDVDAVYGDVHFVRDGQPHRCVRYYSSKGFRPLWLRFGFMPAHPSFYLRKSVYDRAGEYRIDYRIGADYEMMVRLFYTYKIRAKYLSQDFVTMRTGGASTRNMRSRLTLIAEDVRACRDNGVYTNTLMICTKFAYKFIGLLRRGSKCRP
jgi:glycosyltransferase